MDLGESLPDAGIRETLKETGISVEITGLVGIYTDPRHVILYTSNGEARQEFSVVFTARPVGGQPASSDESREVVWVAPEDIRQLTMDRSMRCGWSTIWGRARPRTLDSDWVSAGADVFSFSKSWNPDSGERSMADIIRARRDMRGAKARGS